MLFSNIFKKRQKRIRFITYFLFGDFFLSIQRRLVVVVVVADLLREFYGKMIS